jgi:hypothetical protein
MKRLFATMALIGVFLISFAGAQIQTPINTAVTTGAWTAITLGAAQSAMSFMAQTRGGNSWKFSDSAAGTKYVTVPGGQSLCFDLSVVKGATVFYVQSIGANDTIELFILK